jgi:hypothetical protein
MSATVREFGFTDGSCAKQPNVLFYSPTNAGVQLGADTSEERIKDVNVATMKSSIRAFVRPGSVASKLQYGFAGREIKLSLCSWPSTHSRRRRSRILRPTYADRIGQHAANKRRSLETSVGHSDVGCAPKAAI